MHAVLGNFVDTPCGRLDALAVKMIERDAALPDGVTLLDGLCNVSLGEHGRFHEGAAKGKLRGEGRGKRAPGPVRVVGLHAVSSEGDKFGSIKKNVNGALHVAALDDRRAGAHLDDLARSGF